MKSFTKTIATISICITLIMVGSYIAIPTTPPITLQLLIIFIISGLFSFKISFLSVLIYVIMGFLGLPVFSGFRGGASILLSSNGGFIVGFCILPIIRLIFCKIKSYKKSLILSEGVGLITLYIIGFIWLGYFINNYGLALKFSIIYLPIDIIKGIIAIKTCLILKKHKNAPT